MIWQCDFYVISQFPCSPFVTLIHPLPTYCIWACKITTNCYNLILFLFFCLWRDSFVCYNKQANSDAPSMDFKTKLVTRTCISIAGETIPIISRSHKHEMANHLWIIYSISMSASTNLFHVSIIIISIHIIIQKMDEWIC